MNLGGPWRMRQLGESEWLPAQVPGSMYGDLLRNGKIDEPFYRDNVVLLKSLSRNDYEYERTFEAGPELLVWDRVLLVCEGLDTLAEVTLNGQPIAKTDDMHRTYEWDVKPLLVPGVNTLHVLFRSPLRFVEKAYAENPIWCSLVGSEAGFNQIRKAHYMYGWDWGPILPDVGIWREISLKGFDGGRLKDVHIRQRHENGTVALSVKAEADLWNRDAAWETVVTVVGPDGSVVGQQRNPVGRPAQIVVEKPELWWPNGYGAQPLYKVRVALALAGGPVADSSEKRIGLRTMTWRREPDAYGESFEVVVNGISIFGMGADYIPQDNLLGRVTPERTERLIADCVAANFNMLRVWGGGYFPEDSFYDLCDRYGILVWQDLLFACAAYELTDVFTENIVRETEDNVRRLRHHASLALWCGNNEMEWGWVEWPFPKTPYLRTEYVKQFEVVLPAVVKKLDPDTFHWLASPSSGGGFDNPNDPTRGDVHYWDVWHGTKPFTDYRKHYFRFCSEFGFQSLPDRKTIEAYTLPEDRNMLSYVMEVHQCHPEANGKILNYMAQLYKYPSTLDGLIYASQLVQADAIRYGVEYWRQNRGVCMGAVYWQVNDCWPVTSWASVDYYGRWKALHYAAKRFFAPVLASARETGSRVELFVTSDRTSAVEATLVWRLRQNDGTVLQEQVLPVQVAPLTAVQVADLDFAEALSEYGADRRTYVEFALVEASGQCLSQGSVYFVRPKHFEFLDPKLSAEVAEEADAFLVSVRAAAFAKSVELSLGEADALFSDNYFDLSPGETVVVRAARDRLSHSLSRAEFEQQLRLRSVFDIA